MEVCVGYGHRGDTVHTAEPLVETGLIADAGQVRRAAGRASGAEGDRGQHPSGYRRLRIGVSAKAPVASSRRHRSSEGAARRDARGHAPNQRMQSTRKRHARG